MAQPTDLHWQASKGSYGTSKAQFTLGLHLQPNKTSTFALKAYCDADWGVACVYLGSNLVP